MLGGSLVNGLTKEFNLHRQLGLCCLQGAPSSLIFLTRSLVDSLCQYSSRLFHYRESQKQGNQLFQRELVLFFSFSWQKIRGSGSGGITFLLAQFITKSTKKVMYLLAHRHKQCVKITELALLNEVGREMFKEERLGIQNQVVWWGGKAQKFKARKGSQKNTA